MTPRSALHTTMALAASSPCQPEAAHGRKAERGTSTRLVLVQGRLALAVCLDGVLLCILPLGCDTVAEHA